MKQGVGDRPPQGLLGSKVYSPLGLVESLEVTYLIHLGIYPEM